MTSPPKQKGLHCGRVPTADRATPLFYSKTMYLSRLTTCWRMNAPRCWRSAHAAALRGSGAPLPPTSTDRPLLAREEVFADRLVDDLLNPGIQPALAPVAAGPRFSINGPTARRLSSPRQLAAAIPRATCLQETSQRWFRVLRV